MVPAIDFTVKPEIEETPATTNEIDVNVLEPEDPIEPSNKILQPLNENGIPAGPFRPSEVEEGIVVDPRQQVTEENVRTNDITAQDPYNIDPSEGATVDPGNNSLKDTNTNNEAERVEANSAEFGTNQDTVQNSIEENVNLEDDESYLKVIPLTVPSSKY